MDQENKPDPTPAPQTPTSLPEKTQQEIDAETVARRKRLGRLLGPVQVHTHKFGYIDESDRYQRGMLDG